MANWVEFVRSADGGKVLVNLDRIDRIEPSPEPYEMGCVLWQDGEALYVDRDYAMVIKLARNEIPDQPRLCPTCGQPDAP